MTRRLSLSMPPAPQRVLLDCRWLGCGGAGRATELLLRGLRDIPVPWQWVLWGSGRLDDYRWDVTEVAVAPGMPSRYRGQAVRIPRADLHIFLHQLRPLQVSRAITLVHDTMQLRYGASTLTRPARRLYLSLAARRALGVLTVSQFSASSIHSDLGVPSERIRILKYPVDDHLVRRVENASIVQSAPYALYVGRFAVHKRVGALVEGFLGSSFAANGGRLVLVGGAEDEVRTLRSQLGGTLSAVEIRESCTDDELASLYRSARFVVAASGEEGFGLPVWEARCCGIPVCVADTGALPEAVGPNIPVFAMSTVKAISDAVDAVASMPGRYVDVPPARSTRQFASDFLGSVLELTQ